MKPLPENLSFLDTEHLTDAREARDEKLSPLFRRWPRLTRPEMKELRQLYEERVRIAKCVGVIRRRRDAVRSNAASN
jgi:hypothetical protein